MNPTFYFISGILVYIISLFTLVMAICFFMGVVPSSSSSNFNFKERFICFITGIFFTIPSIIGYDWAGKLVDPNTETIYQRVIEEKPKCDIKAITCMKEMTEWLKDSSDAYIMYHLDSVSAANDYNKAVSRK